MSRDEAESIISATLSLNDGIGQIDKIISSMTDETTKKIWIRKLGGLIGYIAGELQAPIAEKYPHLNPYPHP